MQRTMVVGAGLLALLGLYASGTRVTAQSSQRFGSIFVQCPGDTDGDAKPNADSGATSWNGSRVLYTGGPALDSRVYFIDRNGDGYQQVASEGPVHCMHLAAGDGKVTMADGKALYTFGFSDVTGTTPDQVMQVGQLAANFPAPTITVKEGEEFFLTLSNVGMVLRPDLFDAHSVHFHGFPQAAAVFDGVPESSVTVHMGSSFTYYYKIIEPGTYMYHCHVEATEHMQMGMLGNLWVEPKQNGQSFGGFTKFAYNDGDGTTGYDVEVPLQLGSFDPNFHDLHEAIQPLPFAAMRDKYPMLNGRGYPDTVRLDDGPVTADSGASDQISQKVGSRITATAGQRILLRLSNLAVTRFYTLGSTIPMKIVGHNARLLRGPAPAYKNLSYATNSVTLGGGESVDAILDTTGYPAGRYVVATTNLQYLSNDTEDYGGMMTEIILQ